MAAAVDRDVSLKVKLLDQTTQDLELPLNVSHGAGVANERGSCGERSRNGRFAAARAQLQPGAGPSPSQGPSCMPTQHYEHACGQHPMCMQPVSSANLSASRCCSAPPLLAAEQTAVGDVKGVLDALLNIPASRQRLIYRGRVVRDEQTLQEIGGCWTSQSVACVCGVETTLAGHAVSALLLT
jgi:hypothetical protein